MWRRRRRALKPATGPNRSRRFGPGRIWAWALRAPDRFAAPQPAPIAPRPKAGWAQGRAVYRLDLIAAADAVRTGSEDTNRAGYTVAHSHLGFNAFRHHLLSYRTPQRPVLNREMSHLITARNVRQRARRTHRWTLDAYWHALMARRPQLTAGGRVLVSASRPCPPGRKRDSAADTVERLRRPWGGRSS